jgi:hypothetical protein
MKGSIWAYYKNKDSVEYRFQIDGIKRGVYTKIIDPKFKDWREVGSGVNYKQSTETLIFSKHFSSEDEIIKWVKTTIDFPTTLKSCNTRCTVKVLVGSEVDDKNECKKEKKASKAKSRTISKD